MRDRGAPDPQGRLSLSKPTTAGIALAPSASRRSTGLRSTTQAPRAHQVPRSTPNETGPLTMIADHTPGRRRTEPGRAPPACPLARGARQGLPFRRPVPRPIPIGVDDFRKLREQGLEYVDKSHFVREVLDKGAEIVLLPRPRRFGKTLNMTMLRCFFEKRAEDLSPLFADLSIWQAGDAYRAHFQRYPVVFLTLKGIKLETFDRTWEVIKKRLSDLFAEHRALLDSGVLIEEEALRYRKVIDGTADFSVFGDALADLSAYLHRAHGEKVVLLIDEYDAPIHAGHAHGYAHQVLDFFRLFLTQGLKSNPHLFKAVLTGILRVAKESVFSGLNNLAVYSVLRPDFATCFGFTEPEVTALLDRAGRADRARVVRSWYNGYVFGGHVIYNPWSILSYIRGSPEPEPRPFWVTTSANELVREALVKHAATAQEDIETLLEGGGLLRTLDESVALADIETRSDALFGLLTFSGVPQGGEAGARSGGRAALPPLDPQPGGARGVHLDVPRVDGGPDGRGRATWGA